MNDHDSDASAGAVADRQADPRAADLRILTPVSDEEAAAVTAVLLSAVDAEAAGDASAAEAEPGRHPWVRSSRAFRSPVEVGPGRWVRSAR
ncbi:acyl-CoA carboxylase epsilon subunit [Agromyces sp. H3Y2-19a]|jgi:hypothetical protein|uniref:acyl-CoA carboxylase epsilon subunit n=1 Tax=Agromyces TaxID=33877 RepID=UPI001E583481|nr:MULTISPECIES: acyl-CoA carboxylase epsilon subunit [Agromyces]MCD5347801.1 acyl-CoA carboxylase subunit epsilon [Agromyces sp. S2-1-8]MDF0514613.1 acyl-CoA carboxylase epsilon subunit [Agromyces chromiiresistens]